MGLVDDLRYLIEYDILKVKRILSTMIGEMPNSFETRILMGDAYLRALEFDPAIAQYQAALKITPNSRLAVTKLALCALYTGRYASALQGCDIILGSVKDEQVLVLAALAEHRLGRPEAALARLQPFTASAADDNQMLTFGLQCEIRACRATGRHAEAEHASERLFAVLAQSSPDRASDLHQRSSSYDYHDWSAAADKGKLAQLLARHADTTNGDLRFPASFVMPNDRDALAAFAETRPPGSLWVIKLRGGQGGQSITVSDRVEQALAATNAVVQSYVHPPYLVQERKAHLRVYGLVTSPDPLRMYVYDDGIVRFAPRPYVMEAGWLGRSDIHVTNTALHRNNKLLVVNQDPTVEDQGHVWSLKAYLRQLEADGHDADAVFASIARLAGRFVLTMRRDGIFERQLKAAPARSFAAKLFGFDILLDKDALPWLIEIQRSPAWNGPPLIRRLNGTLAETLAQINSAPLGGTEFADEAALARREQELELAHRGGFVRIIHDDPGETDAARGGREIML